MKSARIGEAVPRVEDEQLLRGRAAFFDDVDCGPGTLHAAFVRSPHAHALVRSVNLQPALALEGVVAAYVAADFAGEIKPIVADYEAPGFRVTQRPVIAGERVRFVGDTLAMVVARDPYVALDAAELVEYDLDPLPAIVEAEKSDEVVFEAEFESDGFEAAHAASDFKLRETFSAARMAAVPIEPRGCAARFDGGKLTMWSSTQVPHMVMTCLAEHLGLAQEDIRVIVPEVGGGFGMKAAVYPEELLVAAAARRLRAPVKWTQDRFDDFLTSTQAREHRYDVEAGFTREGVLTSLLADITVNVGAYASLPFGSSLEANGAPRNMPGPYQLRHFRYRTRGVQTHTCPIGAYRGVAGPLAFFAMEGMLDRIARHLDLDPAEVRRRNVVREFPYRNVLGLEYAEGCFVPALERALELADYEGLRRRQREETTGSRAYGVGVVLATEQTGMGSARYKARGLLRVPGFEGATVKLEADGSASAHISQAAAGQGHATAFAQIVSDRLGVPLAAVRVVEGDTGRTPFGTGTFASRGMVIAGGAVSAASESVRRQAAEVAAGMLECGAGDVEFRDGHASVVGVPGMKVSLREVGAKAGGIESTGRYDTPGATIASMAHVASVVVDKRTGCVQVERYVVVHDCGRMVNPTIVDGQIQGAVVQGLGEVLMEALSYDAQGQPTTTSLMDYQLPRCADVAPILIEALHSEAGGAIIKGVGESGIMGAVPALANAIGDALARDGASVTALPLTAKAIHGLLWNRSA
jgi:carbon-monoxide dehydrogenase large subunit